MSADIKNDFHSLIDKIDNEELLTKFYEIMLRSSANNEGDLYRRLTDDQKEALHLAEEESKYPENLIDHEKQKKKHKRWL